MPGISSLVELKTVRDWPIVAGSTRVTPESQILTLRLPFGGAVWHRPTAVTVERAGEPVHRLRIVDLTRVAQLTVVLGTLLLNIVCLVAASRQEES